MQNPIKISVIMPVYNTEMYLDESINSVLNQTLKEIEVIIIDDGSKDKSLEVIKGIAKKDDRIIFMSHKNSGQSVSRNKGLDLASGDFIYFMDSDDILEKTAFEECYAKLTKDNLDMVFFEIESFPDESYYRKRDFSNVEKYVGYDVLKKLIENNEFYVMPYTYMLRRTYLEFIKIRFYPSIIHEDNLFSFHMYIHALNVGYISDFLYKRRYRADSVMTTKKDHKNLKCYKIVFTELLKYKWKNKKFYDLANLYVKESFNSLFEICWEMTFINKLRLIKICFELGYLFKIKKRNFLILFLKNKK